MRKMIVASTILCRICNLFILNRAAVTCYNQNTFYKLSRTSFRKYAGTHQSPMSKSLRSIPSEINFDDKYATMFQSSNNLMPNTGVESLDGGFNIGVVLWSYILYNGIFTTAGRPSDWILPLIYNAQRYIFSFNQQDNEHTQSSWLTDYVEGFDFSVPYDIEITRVFIFTLLSYGFNLLLLNLFEQDTYWCWSIGACLFIPSALLSIARDKPLTRDRANYLMDLNIDLLEYFNSKITQNQIGKSISEEKIMISFRRNYVKYRTEDALDVRTLKKSIRKLMRQKPNSEGYYLNMELVDEEKRANELLQQSLQKVRNVKTTDEDR